MTADFSKLLDHPDKDEIISKLMTGVPAKEVSDWLRIKYTKPDEKHLQLGSSTLKEFVEGHVDLYNDLKRDIESVKAGKQINKKIAESLLNNKTYADRINEYAQTELDIKKVITDLAIISKDRIEQIFDIIQENPRGFKPDYALTKWMETLSKLLEQYGKYVLNTPDQVIQHNVTVQRVEEYSLVFQEAVREVLTELDPDIAYLFIEKLNSKLSQLRDPTDIETMSQEKRLQEVSLLNERIKKLEE